ncbi:hypothetical protein AB4097_12920 [Microvirga sp. 2MCAF35]|uniref:hypothetical protein n=1 Tax=Microvirga sp. 2MCAF35 TaxID=3232987 RepID=UPI003F97AE0F
MFLSVQSVFRPTNANVLARISTAANGAEANESSSNPHFSPDGRFVVFNSSATNLVAGDTRDNSDIFLKDLSTGAVTRLSTRLGGAETNGDSYNPRFSPDGHYVVFESTATNLVDGADNNRSTDIFLKNLITGAITRLSTPVGAVEEPQYGRELDSFDARFSPDGHYVVFASRAPSLVADDTNNKISDIFLKDLNTGTVTRLSTAANGTAANDDSWNPRFSPNGHFMVFESSASNLDGDGTGTTDRDSRDIFLKDLSTGAVTRLSTGLGGAETNGDSSNPQFSPDGRYVVFESLATNLASSDTNGKYDIFVKDLSTGAVTRLSTTANGTQANGSSTNARFSPDGRYIVFESDASNLVANDLNGEQDIFVKDLSTGAVTRLSTTATGAEANDLSAEAQFSLDGRYVTFGSLASNLIAGDMNDAFDIFRVDLFYKEHAAAIAEGRFLETTLAVGNASSASIAWGDGTSSVVIPTAGRAAFNHAYASTGSKAATVTLVEGALTWNVAHTIDVGTGTMVRNTALADTLSGSAGHDTLTGDAFRNILNGAGGNDRLDGGAGADVMDGGTGADVMDGGADADAMNGSADADVMNGGAGDDRLSGGLGQDRLTGGVGRDVFAFDDRETSASKKKADIILDFSRRQGDRIDLSAIDADTRKRGDQKFAFIGRKDFSKAGEVRFEKTKSATYVYLNTDNDKAAEAVIKLKGSLELSKGWFVL